MITSDHTLLSDVKGARIDFSSDPVQLGPLSPNVPGSNSDIVDCEIAKLLDKCVIETATHSVDEIISGIFLTPKKDGTFRLILNLKQLNHFIPYHHFKMDTLKSILKLVERNCFLASLDLKDAYYSVPVHWSDRKYLRFIWRNQLYQFTCWPNGLAYCPRRFTKLLKPPLTTLHKKGHVIAGYIDDLCLEAKTFEEAVLNVIDSTIQFLELGFVIHPEKSVFLPSQRLELLGFCIDSVSMRITLLPEKAVALRSLCENLLGAPRFSIRELARVIGKMVSSFPGVEYGPLYYRSLEADKTRALRLHKGDFDQHLTALSPEAERELNWWIHNVIVSKNLISRCSPDKVITTDASLLGWGATFESFSTGGTWSLNEKDHHINYLELLAVFLGLKSFAKDMRNVHIRLLVDNTTAVALINNMGSSHALACNKLVRDIWEWCIPRGIWISAAHIPGKLNCQADFESRNFHTDMEWMLNPKCLSDSLEQLHFKPDIDLFASRLNHQFPRYCAFKPDPGAMCIDAFSIPWTGLNFYAFPPFSVVPLNIVPDHF